MKVNNSDEDNYKNYQLPFKSLLGIKVVKYRIVRDSYLGYQCDEWKIWWPFWEQMGFSNTHSTVEDAISYIERSGNQVVLKS